MPKFLVVCALLFSSLHCFASKTITIVTEESYPLNYLKDEQVSGIATDFLRHVMLESGYDYSITLMPWNRAIRTATELTNSLLYSVARTPEREDKFHWLFQIKEIQYYLYGLTGRKEEFVNEDICSNRKIAVVRSDVTHEYLKKLNCGELILAQSYKQLDSLLLKGRVDFIASSALGMKYFIQRHSHSMDNFYAQKKLEGLSTGLYFAMNIDSESVIVDTLKQQFMEAMAHPTYTAIENM